MPRRLKKPWNAGKNLFPELTGGKPVPLPAPMPPPSGPAATLTTGRMVPPQEPSWECLRCGRLKLGNDVTGLDHTLRCPWRDKGDPAVG
jgi:hypothetical protein